MYLTTSICLSYANTKRPRSGESKEQMLHYGSAFATNVMIKIVTEYPDYAKHNQHPLSKMEENWLEQLWKTKPGTKTLKVC